MHDYLPSSPETGVQRWAMWRRFEESRFHGNLSPPLANIFHTLFSSASNLSFPYQHYAINHTKQMSNSRGARTTAGARLHSTTGPFSTLRRLQVIAFVFLMASNIAKAAAAALPAPGIVR
jgi:hypothetical protein